MLDFLGHVITLGKKLALCSTLLPLLCLTSCSKECNIAGNSTVGSLDGRMLYLRISPDGNLTGQTVSNVDSCEVVHGRFSLFSNMDSVTMAVLCMGNESLMPVVLEGGNINVEVDHVGQRVSGGPLNERLYSFLQKRERIENQQWELDRKCMRMMHEGVPSDKIRETITPKATKLAQEAEELETNFIINNFDNPLGVGCFMWLFGQYPTPIMTPQIQRIVDAAPEGFLRDPFVQGYLHRVRR